jgi:hypothetical protein
MSDRRRTNRFVIADVREGSLRLMQDVFVEHTDTATIVVVTDAPLPRAEGLLMELPRELGARSVVPVEVSHTAPLCTGDTHRQRVVLRIAQPPSPTDGPLGDIGGRHLRRLPALGVLIRRVPVRVRDVSTTGCLLESADMLPDGSVGLLEVAVDGTPHSETVRVCRSTRVPGSPWPWRSGGQFLALSAPAPASVRNLVARFEIIDELDQVPETLARMYRRLRLPPVSMADAPGEWPARRGPNRSGH